MAKRLGAGALYHTVAFDKLAAGNPDSPYDYGNEETVWVEQFRRRAAFIHLRRGEAVIAGRLQGRHLQVIQVRASVEARSVGTDWRVRDVATGEEFNIRDISPNEDDRAFIDFLCEKGVAV